MDIQKAYQMSIRDAISFLGLDRTEITENTYIYLDEAGYLCAIESRDRTARPSNEVFSFGYAKSYEDFAEVSVQEAALLKEVSVQAVRDVLRDDARRGEIFPNARRVGSVERGEWKITLSDLQTWQPRRIVKG